MIEIAAMLSNAREQAANTKTAEATLADWRREIVKLRDMRPKAELRIVTGSLDKFTAACERHLGYAMREPSPPKTGVKAAVFVGLRVEKHAYLPENRAMLMRADQVVAIINLED